MTSRYPNQIDVTTIDTSINGIAMRLMLQAQLPGIVLRHGEPVASSRVRIVAQTDPAHMQKARQILFGSGASNDYGILGQLVGDLNNHYASLDIDGRYKSLLAPLLKIMDRLFCGIEGRKIVRLEMLPQQQGDCPACDICLTAIPDRADHAMFTTHVRRSLQEINGKRTR